MAADIVATTAHAWELDLVINMNVHRVMDTNTRISGRI